MLKKLLILFLMIFELEVWFVKRRTLLIVVLNQQCLLSLLILFPFCTCGNGRHAIPFDSARKGIAYIAFIGQLRVPQLIITMLAIYHEFWILLMQG